jgi:hypothetical protein
MRSTALRHSSKANATQPTNATSERERLVEWIERLALDNVRARFATAELIAKEAQTTLTVLLAGIGGTAAYAAKLLEPNAPEPLTVAAAAACAYLTAVAVVLVFACMRFASYPAQFQDPGNLLPHLHQPALAVREAELRNLDVRIREATSINARRADHLNTVRLAAVFSVVVFLAVAAVAPRHAKTAPATLTIACQPERAASAAPGSLRCVLGS